MNHRLRYLAVFALLATSCANTAPKPAVNGAPSTPATSMRSSVGNHRVVLVIPDPALGKLLHIKKYWDYGRDAPFQITGFTANTAPQMKSNGVVVTNIVAQVGLPGATPRRLHLTDTGATVGGASSGPQDGTSEADLPATDEAASETDANIDPSMVSALDQAVSNEPNANDPSEAGDDTYFPASAEVQADLNAAHEVDIEIDALPTSSSVQDSLTFTDKVTGQVFTVTHDHQWVHFDVTSSDGKMAVDFNPDRTFTVDGQAAADVNAAVLLMKKNQVMVKVSRYAFAMMVARAGRLTAQIDQGSTPPSGGQVPPGYIVLGTGVFRILGDAGDQHGRAYVLADALLKALLKGS